MAPPKSMAGPGSEAGPSDPPSEGSRVTPHRSSEEEGIPDDAPPPYDDLEASHIPRPSSLDPEMSNRPFILPEHVTVAEGKSYATYRNRKSYTVTLAPQYSSDPVLLHEMMLRQAMLPPVPFIHITGTHMEKNKGSDRDSNDSHTVTDFDFLLNTAGMVLPQVYHALERNEDLERDGFWELKIVKDNDGQRAYRGRRCRTRYEGRKNKRRMARDRETLLGDTNLEDWCYRFCSNRARVKSFTLHREVDNWDKQAIVAELNALIRSLNYQGNIDITFETHHSHLTVYSPHVVNRLRTNNLVWWICVILPLWLITWPLIFLLERRYEPVRAVWHVKLPASNYLTGMSERQMVKYLAPAIRNAAFGRRKNGEIIDVHDVNRMREYAAQGITPGDGITDLLTSFDPPTSVSNEVSGAAAGQGPRSESLLEIGRRWLRATSGWGANEI